MKKAITAIMVLLLAVMIASMQPMPALANGPRHCKGLDVYFYQTNGKAWAALKSGEVDFIQWALTYEQYVDATEDPSLQLAKVDEMGMYQFDLNNNYTIPDFPGVRSPTNELKFRQALACATDKNWIVNTVLKGFGSRIDVPIAAASVSGWADASTYYPNYDYEFNMTRAGELLDAAGFIDTDDDGTRNYPVDWPGREAGPNLDPIKMYIRNDHAQRLTAGRALADNMRTLGIPVNQTEAGSDVLFPIVMQQINYHIYTGGWSVGRYPTYLLTLFSSTYWGIQNYVTGMNASNEPNYPDVDAAVAGVYYAVGLPGSIASCKLFTVLHEKYCINIPLWSTSSWWAYSKYLVAIVDENGYGLENPYTFLHAYKVDNPATEKDESQEPIRMGTVNAPLALNILYSQWYFDFAVLDRIFQSGMVVEPYNLAVDNPWIFQDWEVSTWIDPADSLEKTKVTYWIRHGVKIVAPETGAVVRDYTAHDLEFTIWYIYAFDDGWQWSSVQDVDHTRVVNDYEIEVYFVTKSIWFYDAPVYPLLYRDEYLTLLCGETSASFDSDGTNLTACTEYQFTNDQVVDIVSVHRDGTPLIDGVDYEILATGYAHNTIHFLKNQPAGTITIVYYYPTVDPKGYYLGNKDWSLWMYSIGPYYPIDIIPGVGGVATLNCNTNFFMETPTLGEIDWVWYWIGTTKPRSGHYQVNMFDYVKLMSAWNSRGDGVPSSNWFPGADIDPTDLCHVGLFDAVLVITAMGGSVNIAVTNVTVSKTVVGQGYCMNVTAVVRNQFGMDLPINITAYANTTIIDTFTNITLPAGSSTTFTFTWNTTGIAKGNYTISAYVPSVLGETYTPDNTLADGSILVTIPGDVDGDFVDGQYYDVFLYDAVKLLAKYGMKEDNPNFNPNYDIDNDGRIFLYDAVILLSHYGQRYYPP